MTKRERVRATIKGDTVDHIPIHSDLTYVTMEKLARYYKVDIDKVEDRIENHLHYVNYLAPREFREKSGKQIAHDSGTFSAEGSMDEKGRIIDEFGVLWDNEEAKHAGDWGMVDHPVKDLDFSGYEWPKGSGEGRFDGIEAVINSHPDRFQTLIMTGLFDTAWHVTGFENGIMAMADPNPVIINMMLDKSLEYLIGVIEQIPEKLFDSVRFIEDWGIQQGLLLGEKHWRNFLKPRLRELYATVKQKGIFVHSHSCGDNSAVFSDLIEIGVDISDPLQPEVMDLEAVKNAYGRDITFMGGLPCQSILPLGTPKEVYEITKETFRVMEPGGHYILGGAGSFPTETPVENIDAIVRFYQSEIVNNKVLERP